MDGLQRAAAIPLVERSQFGQTVSWTGLTDVTYAVQGTTNLLSFWPTLGKVVNNQNSFSFTNWNTGRSSFSG